MRVDEEGRRESDDDDDEEEDDEDDDEDDDEASRDSSEDASASAGRLDLMCRNCAPVNTSSTLHVHGCASDETSEYESQDSGCVSEK